MNGDSGKTLIPNTYQKPNVYSDLYDYYLTPRESKVLDFIVRQILGWDEHRATLRDRISLSQICEGIQRKDGTWQSRGTGLCRADAITAIKALVRFNFIQTVGPATKDGQEYELNRGQLGDIDLTGLEARKAAEHARGMERTATARAKRASGKTDIPLVSQSNQSDIAVSQSNQKRLVSLTSSGKTDIPAVVSQSNPPKPILNPIKPNETQRAANAAASPSSPSTPSSRKVREKDSPDAKGASPPIPQQALVGALAEVTGMDARLNGPRMGKVAAQLARVEATPDLIRQHYGSGGYWYIRDWRGQKGELPRPEQITETWGQWSRPTPVNAGNGHARASPAKTNKTTAAVEEYLRDLEQAQDGGTQILDAQGRVIYG